MKIYPLKRFDGLKIRYWLSDIEYIIKYKYDENKYYLRNVNNREYYDLRYTYQYILNNIRTGVWVII